MTQEEYEEKQMEERVAAGEERYAREILGDDFFDYTTPSTTWLCPTCGNYHEQDDSCPEQYPHI